MGLALVFATGCSNGSAPGSDTDAGFNSSVEAGASGAPVGSIGPPSLGGDRPSDPGRRATADAGGTPWGWIAVAGVLAAALAVPCRECRLR